MQQRNLPLVFNFAFWLLYFLYEWLGLAALSGDYQSYFVNACVALPLSLSVSYLTVDILVKRYYGKWNKLSFWILQILITIVLLLAKRCVNYYLIYPNYFPHALQIPFFSFGKLIVELVNLYVIVGIYSLFYFIRNWYEQRQQVRELQQEKTLAELELLKSQVHPHFIFNTLNNIYSTALKTSPETAKLIDHLSSFLNYNLYESKQNFVSLGLELQYIQNYIELQKIRFGARLDVSINIYDNIQELKIAPLLLLPLIENSFKHGISSSVGPGWIRVDVENQTDILVIKIENSIEKGLEKKQVTNGGLGLKNVRRRLELLYSNRAELKTTQADNTYLVVLKIGREA